MVRVTSDISIGNFDIAGFVSCEITSSYETLTDTCTLTFPRNINWQGQQISFGNNRLIRRGDEVNVYLGYDDVNELSFLGYITSIFSEIPTKIDCQDEAWLLKNNTITKSYKSVTLKELLGDLGIEAFEAVDVSLGALRLTKVTPAQILKELWDKYYIRSWFRNGVLYSGQSIVPSLQKTVKIDFLTIISNQLEFRNEDEIKIKLKVINILPNDEKQEFEFGDPAGEQRTHHVYDQKKEDITTLAGQEMKRLRYTGYFGNFTTFGFPKVEHGDAVELTDSNYPERDGTYLVKMVKTNSGTNGFRQIITLDSKVQ